MAIKRAVSRTVKAAKKTGTVKKSAISRAVKTVAAKRTISKSGKKW